MRVLEFNGYDIKDALIGTYELWVSVFTFFSCSIFLSTVASCVRGLKWKAAKGKDPTQNYVIFFPPSMIYVAGGAIERVIRQEKGSYKHTVLDIRHNSTSSLSTPLWNR